MEGVYKVIAGPTGTPAVTWVFTPCGDGCAEVEMGAQGSQQRATARYVQMNWTIEQHSMGALTCGDGTQVPGTAGEPVGSPSSLEELLVAEDL